MSAARRVDQLTTQCANAVQAAQRLAIRLGLNVESAPVISFAECSCEAVTGDATVSV